MKFIYPLTALALAAVLLSLSSCIAPSGASAKLFPPSASK